MVNASNPTGVDQQQKVNMAITIHLGKMDRMNYKYKDFNCHEWLYFLAWDVIKSTAKFSPPKPGNVASVANAASIVNVVSIAREALRMRQALQMELTLLRTMLMWNPQMKMIAHECNGYHEGCLMGIIKRKERSRARCKAQKRSQRKDERNLEAQEGYGCKVGVK